MLRRSLVLPGRSLWRSTVARHVATEPLSQEAADNALADTLRKEMQRGRNWIDLLLGGVVTGAVIGVGVKFNDLHQRGMLTSYGEFVERQKQVGASLTDPQRTEDVVLTLKSGSTSDAQFTGALTSLSTTKEEKLDPTVSRQLIKAHLWGLGYAQADIDAVLADESIAKQPFDVTRTLAAVIKRVEARGELPPLAARNRGWMRQSGYGLRHRHVTFIVPPGAIKEMVIPSGVSEEDVRRFKVALVDEQVNPTLRIETLALEPTPESNCGSVFQWHDLADMIALMTATTVLTTATTYAVCTKLVSPTTLRKWATGRKNPGMYIWRVGIFIMPVALAVTGWAGPRLQEALGLVNDTDRYRGKRPEIAGIRHQDHWNVTAISVKTEQKKNERLATIEGEGSLQWVSYGSIFQPGVVVPAKNKSTWLFGWDPVVMVGWGVAYFVILTYAGVKTAPATVPMAYLLGRRLTARMAREMKRVDLAAAASKPPPQP